MSIRSHFLSEWHCSEFYWTHCSCSFPDYMAHFAYIMCLTNALGIINTSMSYASAVCVVSSMSDSKGGSTVSLLLHSARPASALPWRWAGDIVLLESLFSLPCLHFGEDSSGPLGKVGLIVPDQAALVYVHAAVVVLWIGAVLPIRVPPCTHMPHPGPASHPMKNVLAYTSKLEPTFGEELHHAAVTVHQEHVRQLCSMGWN